MQLPTRWQHGMRVAMTFVCLSLNNCVISWNDNSIQIQLTRAVPIAEDNFQITRALTIATDSQIACGAHFAAARVQSHLTSENGYYFNETLSRCHLGTVSSPDKEQGQGGIMVYGIGITIFINIWIVCKIETSASGFILMCIFDQVSAQ